MLTHDMSMRLRILSPVECPAIDLKDAAPYDMVYTRQVRLILDRRMLRRVMSRLDSGPVSARAKSISHREYVGLGSCPLYAPRLIWTLDSDQWWQLRELPQS